MVMQVLESDVRDGDMNPLFDAVLRHVPVRDDDPRRSIAIANFFTRLFVRMSVRSVLAVSVVVVSRRYARSRDHEWP
jgi:hypothetical protein